MERTDSPPPNLTPSPRHGIFQRLLDMLRGRNCCCPKENEGNDDASDASHMSADAMERRQSLRSKSRILSNSSPTRKIPKQRQSQPLSLQSPNVEGTPTSRRVSTESSPLYDDENKPNAPSSLSSHMDIDDKPSAELSLEDQQELDEFLTEMSADKMNIIKHIMRGGNLPKALYKFTQNNVLAELPSCNKDAEDNLIELAVETFGDKTRFLKQYTLTANLVLPCIGLQFSFPVKGHNQEMIGPLRANNEFLDEMGIHLVSTGATQNMAYRMLLMALRDYYKVDADTAYIALVHATVWLSEACPFTLHNKAGSKGQEDHELLKKLLKECADDAAAYGKAFLQKMGIEHVLLYGIIAEKFVNENDVFPLGTKVYSLPHSAHLVQGASHRSNVESLLAGIVLVQDLCGVDRSIDMSKVHKIAARECTHFDNAGWKESKYIITGSYLMNDEVGEYDL